MAAARVLNGPVGQRHWFFGAVLLALASALVAALVPSGLPSSRLTGSAFDPSTSAVALRARAQQQDDAAPQAAPRKRDGQSLIGAGLASPLYLPALPVFGLQTLLSLSIAPALLLHIFVPRSVRCRTANAQRAPPPRSS